MIKNKKGYAKKHDGHENNGWLNKAMVLEMFCYTKLYSLSKFGWQHKECLLKIDLNFQKKDASQFFPLEAVLFSGR